ncbi:hypothetical protein OIO90_001592 [Microbotryomycetes sp. JL221]|nr:hypothetical protein OIO90_001592 [Microbotryomycetes sp. JL221]
MALERRGVADLREFQDTVNEILKRADIPKLHLEARERHIGQRQVSWSPDQLVDVTGAHRFIPPTKDQTRGPCPGLNVLANHGYFDRSGVTNLQESITALTEVFNMGLDTATALVAYSIAIIGDPVALTWSIGRGLDKSTLLPGLLSPPGGISQSHNNYESDASIGRGDAFLTNGNVWDLQLDRFKHYYSLQPNSTTANYDFDVTVEQRRFTINESINKNPNFFFSPFPGLVVSTAAHNFVPFFFSNHSAERPEGYLDQATLKSFFSVSGDSLDTLKYTPGHERIPDNWYKPGVPYTLVDVVTNVLKASDSASLDYELSIGESSTHCSISASRHVIEKVPEAGKVGGNTGKVNSFVGVDVADLTGGVLNAQSLLEGNNLICFGLAAARLGLPSVLGGATGLLGNALNFLDSKFGTLLPGLTCPRIDKWNLSVFSQFPGSG